ncbi:MAG: S8 family serine peptidase [Deltaproteobacteria bacterium]
MPLQQVAVWPDLTFVPTVVAALEQTIASTDNRWFCERWDRACLANAVTVDVQSVLPQRSWPPSRADGHLRFLRVRFVSDDVVRSVRPQYQCEAVHTLRTTFGDYSALASSEIYVGRECDASVSSAQAVPTSEMLTWHLSQLGMEGATTELPPGGESFVDLGLIDAGVIPSVASSIGVVAATSQHTSSTYHVHGTAMAIFAKQTGGAMSVVDYRALGPDGTGTMAQIGVSIDDALLGASAGNPARPIVLNLSLGFPPELGRPAAIEGTACSSHENAAGEVVRYVLDVAARMDRDGHRRTFVSAASGNRPLAPPPETFPITLDPTVHDLECEATPAGPELFYPGEWSRAPSCRGGDPSTANLVLAVGAVDDRLRPTGMQIPDAETPLVAPGQHVYASHAAAGAMPVHPVCGQGPTSSHLESLPRAFTGSSVSSALVAGAAARVQAAQLAAGRDALDRQSIARLLYLTGRPLGRTTQNGVDVRVLAIDRLGHALAACPTLIQCAMSVVGREPIPPSTLATCASAVAACGLTAAPATPVGPVAWSTTYLAQRSVCASPVATATWSSATSCGGVCPYEALAERRNVGSNGPQPTGPICPDCPAVMSGSKTLVLMLELTSDGEPNAVIENPYLVVKGPTNTSPVQSMTEFIPLPDDPHVDDWVLGNHLDIKVPLDNASVDFSDPRKVSLGLVVNVTEPGATTVTDFSVIDLQ